MLQVNALFSLRNFFLFALVITGITWTTPASKCHEINAKGKGVTIEATQTGVITEADIIGGGLLNGTTRAEFYFVGNDGGVISFLGELVLSTKHGSVTYQATSGTFNTSTLAFSTDLYVVDGDGRFQGATGNLHIEGVNFSDGSFTENLTGEICISK